MIWSILICSIQKRKEMLNTLLLSLYDSIKENGLVTEIEVLWDMDNKEVSTGAKRNRLLNKATGYYISFIDDDDEVTKDYIPEIYQAIKGKEIDCVGMNGFMTWDGKQRTKWRLSKDYENRDEHQTSGLVYYRKANHLSPVRRELALQTLFPDKSNAEDKDYSERLNHLLKSETYIEKELYHYKYISHGKEY